MQCVEIIDVICSSQVCNCSPLVPLTCTSHLVKSPQDMCMRLQSTILCLSWSATDATATILSLSSFTRMLRVSVTFYTCHSVTS